MPVSRDHNSANKIYLPDSTRENQYLLVDIPLTDELITYIQTLNNNSINNNLSAFYYQLSTLFFNCCDQVKLENAVFLANDKVPKIHFSSEMYQVESAQRILFFYNPALHTVRQSYFQGEHKAKKIKLLFLASGEDVRLNSPAFNAQVCEALTIFAEQAHLNLPDIRVRDHQHLTFTLFAKENGSKRTQGHKLRAIPLRYASQQQILPDTLTEISYAVATLPITESMKKLVALDFASNEPFKPLYDFINNKLKEAGTSYNIKSAAIIANGLVPIVRQLGSAEDKEEITQVGEIQKLSYNSDNPQQDFLLSCDGNMLVNEIYIVMAASKENFAHQGYAKFLQKVENTLTTLTNELKLVPKENEIMIRMHQHISFNL